MGEYELNVAWKVIFKSQNESVPVPPQLLQITIIIHSKVINTLHKFKYIIIVHVTHKLRTSTT